MRKRDDDTPGRFGKFYDLGEVAEILASLQEAVSIDADQGVTLFRL